MRYVVILLFSGFIYTLSSAMDISPEKLQQNLREYWDKLKEEDQTDENEQSHQDRIKERNEENRIITMIVAHVAKL